MGPQRCNCYGCENLLTSYKELVSGICEPHAELIYEDRFKDKYYIGVCWECNNITYVGPRYDRKNNLIITDKYIFSKGCLACTGKEENNLQWMTFKNIPDTSHISKEDQATAQSGSYHNEKSNNVIRSLIWPKN